MWDKIIRYTKKMLYKERHKIKKGFSLVEVILVVGITAVIVTVGINNYISLKNSKTLENTGNVILADITYTMQRSKTQENGSQWWIHMINPAGAGNDYYQICSGNFTTAGADCAAEGGTEVGKRTIEPNISFTDPADGTTKAIVFSKSTGLPTASSSIVIASGVSNLRPKALTVASNGRVDINNVVASGAPSVTTSSASSVGATSATLNGIANPNSLTATGWFRYATTSPGTCNDSFGNRAPTSGGASLGSGFSGAPYNQGVTGLSNLTTYYFCAIANNSSGTSFGSVLSFTTTTPPPTMVTGAATSVASTTATLNGTGNPNGTSAIGWFRYATSTPGSCNDSFGTRVPASSGTSLGAGSSPQAYNQSISGLSGGTIYYFCAIGSNTGGNAVGSVQSFTTTATSPTMATVAASSIGSTSATLNGTGNPNNSSTTGWFRYWTSNPGSCTDSGGTRVPGSGGTSLGLGSTPQAYNETPTGLSSNTTYYFCAIGSNTGGTGVASNVLSFATAATSPTMATVAASGITATTATLNGTGNPNGISTTGWFRYSTTNPGTCDDLFGQRAPVSGGTDLLAGSSPVAYNSGSLAGLANATTYYFCAIGSNTGGTGVAPTILNFTTLTAAPTVTLPTQSAITSTSATLGATVTSNGGAALTARGTCWATTAAPTTNCVAEGGTGVSAFTHSRTGLPVATLIYYRGYATNSVGTSYSSDDTFTTLAVAPTVTTPTKASITSSSATLGATVTSNGGAALTARGTCWDTTPSPTANCVAEGGTGVSAFTHSRTGLPVATLIYYRGYATNSIGTSYSADDSFTTLAVVPTLTTPTSSTITSTSATLGATVTSNGGAALTARGTCWNTTPTPTTNCVAEGGTTVSAFTHSRTSLPSGTLIYYRGYATNSIGTGYSTDGTFTTLGVPTVTTPTKASITSSSATLGATVTSNGGAALTARGTCWGTSPAPTSNCVAEGGTSVSAFTHSRTGLSANTLYYYRGYATNSIGTSYSPDDSFTTLAVAPTMVTVAAASTDLVSVKSAVLPTARLTFACAENSSSHKIYCFGGNGGSNLNEIIEYDPATDTRTTKSAVLPTGRQGLSCAENSSSHKIYCFGGFDGARLAQIIEYDPATDTRTTRTAVLSTARQGLACAENSSSHKIYCFGGYDGANLAQIIEYNPATPDTNPVVRTAVLPTARQSLACAENSSSHKIYCFGGNGGGFLAQIIEYNPATPDTNPVIKTAVLPNARQSLPCAENSSSHKIYCFGGNDAGSFADIIEYDPATDIRTTRNAVLPTPRSGLVCSENSYSHRIYCLGGFDTAYISQILEYDITGFMLNGTGNPNSTSTTGWFRYATTSPGTCDDTFGVRAPTSGGTALAAGSSAVAYSNSLFGLAPGVTHYFCAIGSNTGGTGVAPTILNFTTTAYQPLVTTVAASSVASTTATLNGTGNPNNISSTGWFRYATTNPGSCNDTFGTRAPASSGTALGSGSSAAAYNQGITSLSSSTTYYFCAIASNSGGTGVGTPLSFTTLATPPTVTTPTKSTIAATSAILGATVTSNGGATLTARGTCWDTTPAPIANCLAEGGTAVSAFTHTRTGLTTGTLYYYRGYATNSGGTSYSADDSFTTLAVPTVTTPTKASITGTSATLGATVTSNGGTALTARGTCWGTSPAPTGNCLAEGGTAVSAFTHSRTSLPSNTLIYYRGYATNSVGTSYSSDDSFTTLAGPPTLTTPTHSSVASRSATLGATITSDGGAAITARGTCWGTSPAPTGNCLAEGGTATGVFSHGRSGLPSSTLIYYRGYATNSGGTGYSADGSFTTTSIIGSWTSRTAGAGAVAINAIAYNPTGRFVFGRADGTTMYSTDSGVTWTAGGAAPPATGGSAAVIKNLLWSALISKFVAVGQYAAVGTGTITPAVWTSADSVTWSAAIAANVGTGLAESGTTIVGVRDSAGQLSRSTDGATWTNGTAGTAVHRGVAFGAGLFVTVADAGLLYTSPDGATWTSRTSTTGVNLSHVAWSPTPSAFLAVTTSGTSITSTNGTSWSAGSTGVANTSDKKTRWISSAFMTATSTNGRFDLRETPTSTVLAITTGAVQVPVDIATNGTVVVAVHAGNLVYTAPLNP